MTKGNLSEGGSLSDIRILDLTRVWAGPLATRIMGDFGAEIIKISDPRVQLLGANGHNHKLNRNKKNIGIRLDIPSGREVFLDLVSKSDVVIENFRPRVMRNLDLSFEQLCIYNPNLIMVSMPGFGTDGPYTEFPAFGTTAEALAGIPSLIGYESGRPLASGIAYGDPISGLNAVTLILAALQKRNRYGGNAFIDIALASGPACAIGEYIGAYSSNIEIPPLQGNRHPRFCPHGAFKCDGQDNWVAISIIEDDQWKSLLNVINEPRIDYLRNTSVEKRKEKEDLINDVISSWTLGKNAEWITTTLQKECIPAGTVSNSRQFIGDKHLNARGFFYDVEIDQYGIKRFDGQSIPGNRLPKSAWTSPRDVGEDSLEILTEILGYSEEKRVALEKDSSVHFTSSRIEPRS